MPELDKRGIQYYFQVTLNDYEREGFEPNVPSLTHRIEVFKRLSDKIGKEKVIWRFDPLVLTELLTPRQLLTKIYHIGNELKGYTDKLVFSFIDVKAYRKVQNNLVKETPVNGNQKCSIFGNYECSDFGIKTAVDSATMVQ